MPDERLELLRRDATEIVNRYKWIGQIPLDLCIDQLELVSEIDRLRRMEAALPKTRDGVAVVPGMTLYSSQVLCGRFRSPETVVEFVGYADPEHSEWAEGVLDVEGLYASQVFAEAAANPPATDPAP